MELIKIENRDSDYFDEIWKLYQSAFPLDERRDLDKQIELFKKNDYSLFVALNNSKIIGLLSVWQLDNLDFIEHFAIKEQFRGKGFGTEILKEHIGKTDKTIILEIEKPETETQKKRIYFYEKIGFKLNTYDYVQPSYGKNKKPLSLYLMSYQKELSLSDFESVREKLHKTVYGLNNPII